MHKQADNKLPCPLPWNTAACSQQEQGGTETNAGGECVVQGWERFSITPRQPRGDSRPEARQKRVSGELTYSEIGIFVKSIVPFPPSGKMGMSRLRLKDSEITSAVSNPSAAGAGAHQQAARSAWQRTGACQLKWNVRDGNKTGAVLHFFLMHFLPSPHRQQARGRLLRSANMMGWNCTAERGGHKVMENQSCD